MAMDADERLEVLDAAGSPTGVIKPRALVHRDGDWHRAFHLWVVHPDGCVLLQRRSASKDLAAGKVDVSVGGHVRPGETLPDMLREAEEEIGLTLRPGATEYLETLRAERTYPDGSLDREFQDVYVALVAGRGLTTTPRTAARSACSTRRRWRGCWRCTATAVRSPWRGGTARRAGTTPCSSRRI
jgi:isopentenyldiphosphate isomerase